MRSTFIDPEGENFGPTLWLFSAVGGSVGGSVELLVSHFFSVNDVKKL